MGMKEKGKTRKLGKTRFMTASNDGELENKKRLLEILKSNIIPDLILDSIGLFIRGSNFLNFTYQ